MQVVLAKILLAVVALQWNKPYYYVKFARYYIGIIFPCLGAQQAVVVIEWVPERDSGDSPAPPRQGLLSGVALGEEGLRAEGGQGGRRRRVLRVLLVLGGGRLLGTPLALVRLDPVCPGLALPEDGHHHGRTPGGSPLGRPGAPGAPGQGGGAQGRHGIRVRGHAASCLHERIVRPLQCDQKIFFQIANEECQNRQKIASIFR